MDLITRMLQVRGSTEGLQGIYTSRDLVDLVTRMLQVRGSTGVLQGVYRGTTGGLQVLSPPLDMDRWRSRARRKECGPGECVVSHTLEGEFRGSTGGLHTLER